MALEHLFRGEAEPARLCARGDDQGLAGVGIAAVTLEAKRPTAQVHTGDVVHHDLGAEVLGLPPHLLHQPGPLDDVGKARIVLDVGGDRQLTARLYALNEDWCQHGARRVDRRGVTGGSGPENEELGVL